MPDRKQLFRDIEAHSVTGIKNYFVSGGDPNNVTNGIPLFHWMVDMYTRTPRFQDCVKAFIDAGLKFDDAPLLAVLADDTEKLEELIKADRRIITRTYDLFKSTYTPLTGGTLLHFCAEYNSVACAKILISHGADVNAKAKIDQYGFGGHTPIFHTVNQNGNNSESMLRLFIECKADLTFLIKGLIWGKGYEWETFIPAVNPISYAMMGLLPQMHRDPETVAKVVSLLLKHAYNVDYPIPNVPNAYLK